MTHLTNNPQTNTGMKSKKEILNSISFRLYNCDFELAKHRRLGYEIEQMYEMAIDEAMASTSASQSSPPEGALNGDELGELIDRHIGPMHGGLEMASIDYFKQTGTINGSFRLRLISLLKFHQYKLQDKAALSTPPVSAMEDGWVKVEDELPVVGKIDEGTQVMAYPHYINCHYGEFINARTGNEETGFYSYDDQWCGDIKIHGVTHWRKRLPLPPPPSK